MPGGIYDSSKTRVAPFFSQLRDRDGDWVRELLALSQYGAHNAVSPDISLAYVRGYWGAEECGLMPPVALLSWLIRNARTTVDASNLTDERTRLLQGDSETVIEALRLLRTPATAKAWWIFEGRSYPDALIETPDAIIVVEGKRTEAGPTTATTWMKNRHQILRHMDAAWEVRGRRAVFGFFLVEGTEPNPEEVPAHWREAAVATLADDAIIGSFPHRSPEERAAIAQGFLGVATWQAVCARLDVNFATLPATILDR